jgi:hypothetical protein
MRLEQVLPDELVGVVLSPHVSTSIGELPVAPKVGPSALPNERVSRRELAQSFECAQRVRDVLEVKVRVDRIEVGPALHGRVLEDRLGL